MLADMANEIALASTAVLVIAAGVGWLLARRITRRLEALAGVAEDVSVHGGVDRQVLVDGSDEVARLASAFNTMLTRLAAARDAQERLIQDAAHELRTPLTSLRTNASVLRRIGELPPDARNRLVADVQGETRELSHLVDELVELALARRTDESDQIVDLAALADGAAARVERRTGRQVRVDADGTAVRGRRQGLERALGNLLENAAKFDDSDAPVEVHIRGGRVTVLDRGPGIDAADAGRVFDRFYRADGARGLPGSGLGLSIVDDVARAHGGTVFAGIRPGGGAAVGFTIGPDRLLPGSEPGHADASPEPSIWRRPDEPSSRSAMSTDSAAVHADHRAGRPRPGHATTATPSTSPRASDAERADTVARLHEALGAGRLDLAETDERVAAAYAARHRHELADLLTDLPAGDTTFTDAPRWNALWTLVVWRLRTTVTGVAGPRPSAAQHRTAALLTVLAVVWFVVCAVLGALAVGA